MKQEKNLTWKIERDERVNIEEWERKKIVKYLKVKGKRYRFEDYRAEWKEINNKIGKRKKFERKRRFETKKWCETLRMI